MLVFLLIYLLMPLSLQFFSLTRMPTPVLHNSNPYQKISSKEPDYNFIKTFGCLCFLFFRTKPQISIDLRFILACLSRIVSNIEDIVASTTGKVYLPRHVVFDDQYFHFQILRMFLNLSC